MAAGGGESDSPRTSAYTAADVDRLCTAATANNADEVEAIVARFGRAIVNEAPDGMTPLLRAADRGAQNAVRALLGAGAEVDLRPLGEWSALHLAVRIAHFGIVEDLLKAGAKQVRTRTTAATPLHVAADGNLVLVTELLLAHGADPNASDAEGCTALHRALLRGSSVDPKLVHALLTFGANPLQRTAARRTAVEVARDSRCADAVVDDLLAFEALAVKRLHETLEAATGAH